VDSSDSFFPILALLPGVVNTGALAGLSAILNVIHLARPSARRLQSSLPVKPRLASPSRNPLVLRSLSPQASTPLFAQRLPALLHHLSPPPPPAAGLLAQCCALIYWLTPSHAQQKDLRALRITVQRHFTFRFTVSLIPRFSSFGR
jgi:hypothetical protein